MERKDNFKDLYIGIGSNIGNPVEISVNQLASLVLKLTNSKSKISIFCI